MQVERAKAKANGSVWNGPTRPAQNGVANGHAPISPITAAAQPGIATTTPSAPPPQQLNDALPALPDGDHDLMRPATRPEQLYDATSASSRPASAAKVSDPAADPTSGNTGDIEAKLAAVSLSAGVVIGPPVKLPSVPASAPAGPPSYARIVRRD
jgi:hypothetical protein